jgi:hypothetical protein
MATFGALGEQVSEQSLELSFRPHHMLAAMKHCRQLGRVMLMRN